MAYEYEKENIIKVRHFNIMTGSSDISKPTQELQEVYHKAKAFDAIRKIEIQSDIKGYHDDTESYMHDVESVIEKYLEDE